MDPNNPLAETIGKLSIFTDGRGVRNQESTLVSPTLMETTTNVAANCYKR